MALAYAVAITRDLQTSKSTIGMSNIHDGEAFTIPSTPL